MRKFSNTVSANVAAFICFQGALLAQNAQHAVTLTAVPSLIRINSSYQPANGNPRAANATVTLSIYDRETGGSPLWQETQTVTLDADGHYTALLGSSRSEGLPTELFTNSQPRWLGLQFQGPGEVEQARQLLASVPYALKAADADTLGGLPASAYLHVDPQVSSNESAKAVFGQKGLLPKITSGTTNFISQFVNSTDLGNSPLYNNSGKIGLGTTTPLDFFHVAFSDTTGTFTGYAVQNLSNGGSAFSGMLFYDQTGALGQFQGFNNSTHEYRINNIAKNGSNQLNGSINFMIGSSSKFLVRSDGDIDIPGSIRKNGSLFIHNLGLYNFAAGLNALAVNTGAGNTAVGHYALAANTTATSNTALGTAALSGTTVGGANTALGFNALAFNTTGQNNTSTGHEALTANTTGSNNTSVGYFSLNLSTVGSNNTALGASAGINLTSGNYNIFIANQGLSNDDHVIRIGDVQTRTYIAGISGVPISGGAPVYVDSTGHLGNALASSRRFKEDIQDMGDSSSGLLRLRPVTYRYKEPSADGSKPMDYGLIAEEVAEVYPGLVFRSPEGRIDSVQYHKLVPMLLNEIKKQNDIIRSFEERLSALEKR